MSFKVIVLPHAGGMASAYSFLKKHEDGFIEFELVELAGHGSRTNEPLNETVEQAAEDIYYEIQDIIEDNDYVILGHSMGSWLAYELYYKILEEDNTLPLHIDRKSVV